MRLPSSRWSAASRMLTGTIARRPAAGGVSPRAMSRSRSAAVTRARTTSLTVPPSARLIALSSSSDTSVTAIRRCSLSGTLRLVFGAATSSSRTSSSTRARAESSPSAARRGWRTRSTAASVAASGRAARRRMAPGLCGSTSGGDGGAGLRRGGCGSASSSTLPASTEPTPSTRQWCVLVTRAQRPPASPCSRTTRHSGRPRSRRCDQKSAAQASSSRSPPGLGSAERVTWAAMSKRSSGTQDGQCRPPVVRLESRWR